MGNIFVLTVILVFQGPNPSGHPASVTSTSFSQEFFSEQACNTAASRIRNQMDEKAKYSSINCTAK